MYTGDVGYTAAVSQLPTAALSPNTGPIQKLLSPSVTWPHTRGKQSPRWKYCSYPLISGFWMEKKQWPYSVTKLTILWISSKVTTSCGCFFHTVIYLCTNPSMLDQARHEKLQHLQLFALENHHLDIFPAVAIIPQTPHMAWQTIFVFLQNLTPCNASAAHVNINKAWHFPSFVHILQMNCNSAWQDHRYCSIDIKCIQAGRWTKARGAF